MIENKVDLKSLSFEELNSFILELGEPKFRATQIFEWLYRGVVSFDDMTNISKATRKKLYDNSYINVFQIAEKQVSRIDGTVKYLFKLLDGECIETVVMTYEHGTTVCISTEVGCRMNCSFCASCLSGLTRKLKPSEMADQIIFASKDLGKRIDNVVLMGIGEPLDNFDNVIKFLYNINHINGLNIGMRHISLSTCGIVPKIYELAELNLQLTLSISLHAADDETRSRIMPINKKYNLKELMSACKYYFNKTGRRISFEYAIISNVNDGVEDARKLAKIITDMPAHINIIPVNNVRERSYNRPSKERIEEFIAVLKSYGITATVRRRLGSDIDAACGQLRHKRSSHKEDTYENLRNDR